MRRTLSIIAVAVASIIMSDAASAQNSITSVNKNFVDRVDTIRVEYLSRYTSSFWDNWTLGITGGANVLFAEEDNQMAFGKRIAPAAQLSAWKELFPALSMRAAVGAGHLYGWNSGEGGLYRWKASWYPTDPAIEYLESKGIDCTNGYFQNMRYFQASADMLFNIRSIINSNRQIARTFDMYAYLGAEHFHVLKANGYYHTQKVGLRAGIIADLNLTPRVSLTGELSGVAMDATFNSEIGKGMTLNAFTTLSFGVKIRLGNQGYRVERLLSPVQYSYMQDVLQSIREEYDEPVWTVELVDKEATNSNTGKLFAPSIVFDEGEVTFPEELQMVNLYRMAKFMEQNPDVRVVVIGNTQSCDNSLARRRAEAIRTILIERYGIQSSRLKVLLQNVNREYNVTGRSQTVNFGALL